MESILSKENKVKKPLEVWQGVVGAFVIISFIAGLYGSQINAAKASATIQENHEQRIKVLETNRDEMRNDIKETKAMVTDIRIILKDKQDRK